MDDIVNFLADQGAPQHEREVLVAYSNGRSFSPASTWHSDFGAERSVQVDAVGIARSPLLGSLRGTRLSDIVGGTADEEPFRVDMFGFRDDGAVKVAGPMGNLAYPAGAPWENYRWFPEKALGAAQYPQWVFDGPGHCVSTDHRFGLRGASGVGGPTLTTSSVRAGGRAGHILQELGHSIFANCFRSDSDVFGLSESIFEDPFESGGFGAGQIATICVDGDPDDFYDCRQGDTRKAEHIFLGLLVKYRLNGHEFRERITTEPDATYRAHLSAAYEWFKENWFDGVEFRRGPSFNVSLTLDGVQCPAAGCERTLTAPDLLPTVTVPVNVAQDTDSDGDTGSRWWVAALAASAVLVAVAVLIGRLLLRR